MISANRGRQTLVQEMGEVSTWWASPWSEFSIGYGAHRVERFDGIIQIV
jgi:hypothetical protein